MKYMVIIPIAGHISKEIEANSPEEAIQNAMDEEESAWDIQARNDWFIDDLEMLEAIVDGNCCHVSCSKAYAEEMEE